MKKVLQWIGLALVLAGLVYLLLLEKNGMDFQSLTKPLIFALLLTAGAGAMLFGEGFDKLARTEKRVRDLEDEVLPTLRELGIARREARRYDVQREKEGLLVDLARVQDDDSPRDPVAFARRVAAALAGQG